MQKILAEINKKLQEGYLTNDLEINFGFTDNQPENEGYYLSKIHKGGSTPITEVLCGEDEVEDSLLIIALDRLNIAHCI